MAVIRIALGALLAFGAIPVATHAAQQEPQIEELVVVGQYLYNDRVNALKTPTPIIDVPQSLSIITADQIANQGFTSVGNIIDYTPGVSTSQGEDHRDAVVFRGVRSTADFFIDGVRDDVQYYRPLYNLEQVEILRGPNALLFGRGGAGGILNRVTRKGVTGDNFSSYRADAGTFGEFGLWVDGNLSVSPNSALRVNAFYENLNNHRDFHDGDRFGVNPTARFELSPATTLDLAWEYVDHRRAIDRGIPTGSNGRPVERFRKIVFGDPELNHSDIQAHLLRAAVQHNFGESLKANFSAFYGDYDKLYSNFYVSGYSQSMAPDQVTLDGYVDTTQRKNLILSGNLVGEIGAGGTSHTIVAGVEYIDTASDQDRFNALWDTTQDDNEIFMATRPLDLSGGVGVNAAGVVTSNNFTTDLNDDTRVDIQVVSAYIQDEIELSERLDAIIGVRFDRFDIDVFNVPADEARHRKDEEITPRFGLIFKPQEQTSIYLSYSESFLPRSGEQFANINGDAARLDPNVFKNLEGGVKWDLSPGASLTAAVFEIEQSSPQVADDDPSTLDVIDSRIKGFEAQFRGQVAERWFVTGGYSYLDGEQVNRSGATGLRPREVPEHMFSLYGDFRVTERFGVGAGLVHVGESFINNSNSATLPSYTRLDAAAWYQATEKLRVQINVQNLTDTLYFPNAHSTHQATVGAPINARLTVIGRM